MIECLIDEESFNKVMAKLKKAGVDSTEGMKAAINTTALMVRSTAIRNLNYGSKSGVTYYREVGDKYMTVRAGAGGPPVAFIPGGGSHNLSLTHTASAPGESPASDTGQLASSVDIRFEDYGFNAVIYSDNSRANYGAWLEYGTRKVEPRPWLIPALYANKDVFYSEIEKMIGRVTEGHNR